MNPLIYPYGNRWTFEDLQSAWRTSTELVLRWELNGDTISEDYELDQIESDDLMDIWLDWVWQHNAFSEDLGAPHVPIQWFVVGGDAGVLEYAPPLIPSDGVNFRSRFTEPVDTETGEEINWLRLPVIDKLWRPGRDEVGGFVQEATGWKPSALQPALDLRVLGVAGAGWGGAAGRS